MTDPHSPMPESPHPSSVDALPPEATAPRTPGAWLAHARAAHGLSLVEVAERLRMSVRQVEALEAERWDEFASPAILRGFVRSYAKLLNLEAEPLLAHLPAVVTAPANLVYSPSVSAPLPGQPRTWTGMNKNFWLAAMVLMIVLAAGVLYWIFPGRLPLNTTPTVAPVSAPVLIAPSVTVPNENVLPPAPEPPSAPSVSNPAPLAASVSGHTDITPSSTKTLMMNFLEESWVEVRQANQAVLARGLQPKGSELVLSGQPPLQILIGNARQVRVTYQGQMLDLTPYTGDRVARLILNE